MRRNRRLAILAATAIVAGAFLAGGVIAGQFVGFTDPEEFSAAVREDPLVRVADIGAAGGSPAHGVFVQPTSAGLLCLWDAAFARALTRQGGCNSADDPLGGRQLFISFAYDGGPAVADVRDARLVGLASSDVASVELVMSDGTRRTMALRKATVDTREYQAFGYRVNRGDLRKGVTPSAVLALDAFGGEVDRQPTGFAG